jgi:hypothetical protein
MHACPISKAYHILTSTEGTLPTFLGCQTAETLWMSLPAGRVARYAAGSWLGLVSRSYISELQLSKEQLVTYPCRLSRNVMVGRHLISDAVKNKAVATHAYLGRDVSMDVGGVRVSDTTVPDLRLCAAYWASKRLGLNVRGPWCSLCSSVPRARLGSFRAMALTLYA